MPTTPPGLRPGDLLATRGDGWASVMIRLGAAFRDQANLINHIAIVHHTDDEGTIWCVEGRPGGVGWRDATGYLNSHYTLCNSLQPKTDKQRKIVTDGAEALLGTKYDWLGIVHDAAGSLGLDKLWSLKWGKEGVPGQVVCSSLADWLYTKAKLDNPAKEREVTPADWVDLWIKKNWAARPKAPGS